MEATFLKNVTYGAVLYTAKATNGAFNKLGKEILLQKMSLCIASKHNGKLHTCYMLGHLLLTGDRCGLPVTRHTYVDTIYNLVFWSNYEVVLLSAASFGGDDFVRRSHGQLHEAIKDRQGRNPLKPARKLTLSQKKPQRTVFPGSQI